MRLRKFKAAATFGSLTATVALLAGMQGAQAQSAPGAGSFPGSFLVPGTQTSFKVSGYIKGMREAYVAARQAGRMTPAQFVLAVKADESLTAVWNRLLAAQKAKNDTYALWAEVIQATTTLENLILAWIPPGTLNSKPAALGLKP
jgi:hypothetical protein